MSRPDDPRDPSRRHDALIEALYQDLVRIAGRYLASERPDISLQPADLVHEAYLKLQGMPGFDARGRGSFLALAAKQMRHVLVDHARRKAAQKRDAGGAVVRLHSGILGDFEDPIEALALDQALIRLAERRPRVADVFEFRFLAGMTVPEIAEHLGVSERTVKSDWSYARAWILEQILGRTDPES